MTGNKIDAAIESYTKAIEMSPMYAEAYVRRGMARRGKGDLAGAIEDYEKATSIDEKSTANNSFVAEAYSNRGFIRLNALDVGGAIADYTKAIDIFPGEADHYYKRGNARLVNEDLEGAIADLDKALALVRPENFFLKALIYSNRGMAKHLQGKEAEARKDLDESVRLSKGEKRILDQYLMDIEMRIMLLRKRRAVNQRGIT
jgi:tetratricopeptide (TPR) repeat protein